MHLPLFVSFFTNRIFDMKSSANADAFEKKLKRLMNKLESEREALNKILKSVGNENKHNQLNK
jgi:hypothetical protein